MLFYTSPDHGCVYTIIDNALFYAPIYQDDTVNLGDDDWCEVDFMSLMGEEQFYMEEINEIERKLLAANEAMSQIKVTN